MHGAPGGGHGWTVELISRQAQSGTGGSAACSAASLLLVEACDAGLGVQGFGTQGHMALAVSLGIWVVPSLELPHQGLYRFTVLSGTDQSASLMSASCLR